MAWSLRRSFLVCAALFSSAVAGCSCESSSGQGASLTIVSPVDGLRVNRADDVLPEETGVQIEVLVAAQGLDGATVSLSAVDGRLLAPVSAPVKGGEVRLVLTLDGPLALAAVARDADGRLVQSVPLALDFDPSAQACRFLAPVDGSTLTREDDASEEPGFQHDVRVRCVGVELGNAAALTVNGAPWAEVSLGAGGAAEFAGVELPEGSSVLAVSAADNTGARAEASAKVDVDTGSCRVTVSPPNRTVFNARGEGLGAVANLQPGPPMSAKISVDADCPGAVVELVSVGEVIASGTVTSEALLLPVTLADGEMRLRAVVSGAASGASPLVRYLVDSVVPTAEILFPLEGGQLHDADDVSPEPGMQIVVRGRFTGIAGGETFELVFEPGELAETVVSGVAEEDGSFEQLVTVPDGPHRILARARRPSGTTARSEVVSFASRYVDATLVIVSPADGTRLGLAHDARPGEPGFHVSFSLRGENLAGMSGVLSCGTVQTPFVLDENGEAELLVPLGELPCEGRELVCTARTTEEGAAFESAGVGLFVDATPPEVTLLAPEDGAVLGSALVLVQATTSCPDEAQQALVLLDGMTLWGPEPLTANALDTPPLPLPKGESALVLRVSDAVGNETDVPFRLFVDPDAPEVRFIDPPEGERMAFGEAEDEQPAQAGFQKTIVVAVDNKPAGTLVELRVDDRAALSARTVVVLGQRLAVFDRVTLPEGETDLLACATDDAGSVACAVQGVRVSTGRPLCRIATPRDGSALGHDADLDPDTEGLQVDVVVQTDAAGGPVRLEVSGPSGAFSASAVVQDGAATFGGVSLDGEGQYTLSAFCPAEEGPEGVSLPNEVRVTFTAPSLEMLSPVDGQVFNLASVDRSTAPGFQIDVRVRASEVSPGAVTRLSVDCGQGPADAPPVGLNSQALATFRGISLPDVAECELSARLEDAAGNISDPVVHRVRVKRLPPAVHLEAPQANAVFGKLRDADPGTLGFELALVSALVSGAEEGTLRLKVAGQPVPGGTFAPAGEAATRAQWAMVELPEGRSEISVQATDDVGNVGTGSVFVTVDTLGPVVTIASLSDGQVLNRKADVDLVQPGLQVNVKLAGQKLVAGTTVRLCSSKATSGDECVTGAGRELASAVLAGADSVLPKVTLPEGEADLYAEAIDIAGNAATSSVLRLLVDSTPPVVEELTLSRFLPAPETVLDTRGGIETFGQPENSSAGPGFRTRLRARLSGVEVDRGLRARFVDASPASGTLLGSPVIQSDGTVTLDVTLAEGGHRIHVLAWDLAGNPTSTPSDPHAGDPPVLLNFGVDLRAPSVVIVSPGAGTLLAKNDVDPEVPGLQVDVTVDSDAGAGREVKLLVDGAVVGVVALPPAGRRVTARVTLPEGARVLGASAADAAGNVGQAPGVSLFVDTVAPVLHVTSPGAGSVTPTPSPDGLRIAAEVTYSQVEAGREIVLLSNLAGPLATALTDAGGKAAFASVVVPAGAQTLTARVSDASGNVTTSPEVAVVVEGDAPVVRFESEKVPLRFGVADGVADGKCSVSVRAACDVPGASVALHVDGVLLRSQTFAGTTGAFEDVVIAPGATVTLQLEATDAQSRTGFSAPRQATCSLVAPSVTFTDPAAATVKFVAHGNPGNVPDARENNLPSTSLVADFVLNVVGAAGGELVLTSDIDGEIAREPVSATPATVRLSGVTVPSGGSHKFTATARDAFGNSSEAVLTALVDVIAPGSANAGVTVLDGRLSLLELAFAAPGGDDMQGPAVARYEVRRSQSSIDSDAAWDAATVVDVTDYVPAAPGQRQKLVVEGLPFEEQYFFAVRAVDDAGNLGPLGTSPMVDLMLRRQRFDAPAVSSYNDLRMVTGDLDGDGYDDFVVSSPVADGNAGRVTVHYGGPVPPPPVSLAVVGASRFGAAVTAGDLNGDGLADLVVAADAGDGVGLLHVYLSRPNTRLSGASAPDATISLADAGASPVAFELAVLDDVNEDGVSDLAVGLAKADGTQGAVLLFAGRSTWPAKFDQTSALARVTAAFRPATGGTLFGFRLVSMGDVDGDGAGDFASVAQGGTLAQDAQNLASPRPVYVMSGRLARGSVKAEDISAAVYPTAAGVKYSYRSKFGFDVAAGDFTGEGRKDLLVTDQDDGKVWLFSGSGLGEALPATAGSPMADASASLLTTTTVEGLFPALRALGDVDGDGVEDFAATRIGGTNALNELWIWRGRSESAWSAAPRPAPRDVTVSAKQSPSFGVRAAGLNFTGESHLDLVVLDLGGGVTVLSGP